MIVEQHIDDRILHFSDNGKKILQNETGIVYETALDTVPCIFTYSETDEPISDSDAEEPDFVNALERLGVKYDEA